MTTSNSQFQKLILQAEDDLKKNQSHYKRRLFLYSLLGYGVILGLLGIVVFLLAGTIGLAIYSTAFLLLLLKKKLILPLIVVLWVLIRSLWVRIQSPQGYNVDRTQCPALFAELDQLRTQLKTPPIHKVILTPELNAGIQQTPKWGIFGGQENTLLLGLELLLILSRDEAKAVLAHEFGHLSGNHSRFNAWIYRSRQSWQQIMYSLGGRAGYGTALLRKFFDWYSPRFSAYSFALARLNEYEADAVSASVTSPQIATNALVNTFAVGPYVQQNYWARYFEKADHVSRPEHAPFVGLHNFVTQNPPASGVVNSKLQEALNWQTNYDDTHPALKDRLAALGCKIEIPQVAVTSAAHEWLGDLLPKIIHDFDDEWMTQNIDGWTRRHETVKSEKKTYANLKGKSLETLSREEHWTYVVLSERYDRDINALQLYTKFQEIHGEDAYASFAIGRLLLEQEDPNGLLELRKTVQTPDICVPACRLAFHFLLRNNREDEAEEWRTIANKQMQVDDEAKKERQSVTAKDTFSRPHVDPDIIKKITEQLKRHDGVKQAWLAEKTVAHYPQFPVLIFAIDTGGFGKKKKETLQHILEQIESPFTTFGVVNIGEQRAIFRSVKNSGVALF